MSAENSGKIFVVDTNLFFVKRLIEALKQRGFEAVHCPDAAYALTMVEWNMPLAILCSFSNRGPESFEIPAILRSDAKTSHIPVIALGDRGQQSQLEALRMGYEDFVDRRLGAEGIVAHMMSILFSRRNGFQPTQMLASSDIALDGRLSLVDLPGVIQVLSQSRQTGGLHINADGTDGIMFFDAGVVVHAESGELVGDDAVIQLVKSSYLTKDGVYKFIPGDAASLRTVHGNLSGLILDSLRELDEQDREIPIASKTQAAAEVGGQECEEIAASRPTPEALPSAHGATDGEEASSEVEPIDEGSELLGTQTEPFVCFPVEDAIVEVSAEPEDPSTNTPAPASYCRPDAKTIVETFSLDELDELLDTIKVGEGNRHE